MDQEEEKGLEFFEIKEGKSHTEEKAERNAIFPSDDVIKRCKIFSYLGKDAEEYYNNLWKELKVY